MKHILPLLVLALVAGGCRPKVLVEKSVMLGNVGGTNDTSLVTFESRQGERLDVTVQCDAALYLTITDSQGQFLLPEVRIAEGATSREITAAHDGLVIVKLKNINLFKDKTAFVRVARK